MIAAAASPTTANNLVVRDVGGDGGVRVQPQCRDFRAQRRHARLVLCVAAAADQYQLHAVFVRRVRRQQGRQRVQLQRVVLFGAELRDRDEERPRRHGTRLCRQRAEILKTRRQCCISRQAAHC